MARPKKKKVAVGEGASSSKPVELEAVEEQLINESEPKAGPVLPLPSPASLSHQLATAAARAHVSEMSEEVAACKLLVCRKKKEHKVVQKLYDAKLGRLEKRERSKSKLAPHKLLNKLFDNELELRKSAFYLQAYELELAEAEIRLRDARLTARDVRIAVLERSVRRLKKCPTPRSKARLRFGLMP